MKPVYCEASEAAVQSDDQSSAYREHFWKKDGGLSLREAPACVKLVEVNVVDDACRVAG